MVFVPDSVAPVLECMDRLASAHDGWINFLPGVPEEAGEERSGGMFSALFGTAQPPVSMSTWMPAAAGHRSGEETIGIMHPRGANAAAQLATMGIPVPSTWRVRQDHVRRGMIVHPLPGAPHAEVLGWTLRAGAALTVVPLTGSWQAKIFLPRDGG